MIAAAGFAAEDLSEDVLLGGKVRLRQPRRGYRAATDPVLLAAACEAKEGEAVLDLGCGAGAALICLMARRRGLSGAGLELQPAYAALARENLTLNGLAAEICEGDVAAPPEALRRRSFDHVLCNPPFFRPGEAPAPGDGGRDAARREGEAGLEQWIATGLRRLRPGGVLTLIHRTARLPEILAGFSAGAGDIAVLPLAARRGRAAERVIVRGRKGARGEFTLSPAFVLHEGDHHLRDGDDFTPQAQAVLRGQANLLICSR